MLVCLLVAQDAPAQTAAAARSDALRGRVVDAANNAPLRRARLTVSSAGRQIETIFTDDEGRFTIPNLPAAALTVRAGKAGYAPGIVDIAAGGSGTAIGFALPKSAAVMGRVLDVNRARVSGAYVIARLLLPNGEPAPAASARFAAQSDALGDYRLAGLPAGRYAITAARIPPERRAPGTRVEDQLFGPPETLDVATGSVTLALAAGGEARDIDFTIPGVEQRCLAGPRDRAPDGAETASITGRVMAASGEPLVCATVRVVAPDVGVPPAFTDRQGRYWIEGLPAGSFLIEARQSGYLPLQYGQRTPSDVETPITLRAGEQRARADIVMPRESLVRGTVVDEHGEPMEGILVWAFQLRRVDGRLTAQANTIPRPTDDRGQYRVIGLRPGTYVVAAMPPPAVSVGTVGTDGARGYASIYYPGTADAATAQRIALAAGRDAQGIDISFFPTPTASVTGVVVDATGRPFPGRPVSLSVSGRSGGVSMSSYGATTDAAGAFVIRNVPPGDYVVKFLGLDGARSFGMQYVTVVDDDPPPVRVTVSGGATLEGRVVIEAASNIDIGGLTVSVASADFDYTPPPPQGSQLNTFRREDDGSFRATGAIGPSRIVVIALGCEPCYLKSAYVNGTDAAHRPFDFGLQGGLYRNVDVTVSDGGATIEGHVLDERDARAATYAVVVFPVDRSLVHSRSAYVKAARAQADGSFRVTGLPPGDYVAAAVSRLDFGISEISDDDVLDQLAPRGQRVSLAERERRALTLTLVRR